MKAFEQNSLLFNKFIQGWYIDEKVCDKILKIFKINHNMNSTHKHTPPRNYYFNKFEKEIYTEDVYASFLSQLKLVLTNYLNSYEHAGANGIHNLCDDLRVQYFKPPEHYDTFHYERNCQIHGISKTLVFITYLNDVVEDGETEFYYHNERIKPKKGLTIVFPTEWTHTHQGRKTNEDKYILTGWFEYSLPREDFYINLDRY